MQARLLRVVLVLSALSLALACGEESDDDKGDSEACPAEAPQSASSCSDFDPGLACTYGGTTCTCSGITWNCAQGGGNTNTSGGPTGSGGNGFGPQPTG